MNKTVNGDGDLLYGNSSQQEEKSEVILFEIEQHLYGVEVCHIDEIVPMMELEPISDKDQKIEGIMNLRGEFLPVLDLTKKLGFQRKEYPFESRVFITTIENKKVGLIVDKVRDIQFLQIETLPLSLNESKVTEHRLARLQTNENVQLISPQSFLKEINLNLSNGKSQDDH